MVGSSPLARGLPLRRTACRRRRADHPRSRGVYSSYPCGTMALDGSSPLARGLRHRFGGRGRRFGIIPARAGFTKRMEKSTSPSADHPRSRGVYPEPTEPPEARAGSSPLARGLRLEGVEPGAGDGIIPARAGFTGRACGVCRLWRDHPRSRGVYLKQIGRDVEKTGSSPLARGLRVPAHMGYEAAGIIPARAGFTCFWDAATSGNGDHPRSRGVYFWFILCLRWSWGSSPLARGLRAAEDLPCIARGIIPARAGFTVFRDLQLSESADHPRSRGVYGKIFGTKGAPQGSSPLARGLRCC